MGYGINRVVEIGRLIKDAQLDTIPNGDKILKFVIAVEGNKKDEAFFFKCLAWGKIGESIAQYLKKGIQICVDGHLEQKSFIPKGQDKKVSDIQIVADKVKILTPKLKAEPQTNDSEFYTENDENVEF